ncbi:MAG: hypothetical protein GY850_28095, partial [bacterium]|nr:hypothetical protein [bacterium]
NLDHLDYLNEETTFNDRPALLTHIYCEYPDYQWVDAASEGIACVDDVARSLQVYLNEYERTNDESRLKKARLNLNFLLEMQAADGQWYNFIYADHSINKEGRTSKKKFEWWAVRGMRALCHYYRVSVKHNIDVDLQPLLKERIELCLPHIQEYLQKYGQYRLIENVQMPAWLINNGTDVSGEAILALIDYYRVNPDQPLMDMIIQLSDGLARAQLGDRSTFPLGLHL